MVLGGTSRGGYARSFFCPQTIFFLLKDLSFRLFVYKPHIPV